MISSDSDQMKVDTDIPTSNSGSIYASSSNILKKIDENSLNDHMNTLCEACYWRYRLVPDIVKGTLSDILREVLEFISATEVKNSFIKISEMDKMLGSLDNNGLEELSTMVQECMKNEDWKALIVHPKLRNPKVPNVALGVPIELRNAVMDAWKLEYLGSAHEVLLKAIDDLHNMPPARNYCKILPIASAQSSGMGKSKTVDKVARERILLPMCLREDIGKDCFAYPLSDKKVREYFDLAPSTSGEARCKQHLRAFLSSLFTLALDLFKKLLPGNNKVPYAKIVEVIYKFFANTSNRDEFYEDVVKNAREGPYIELGNSFNTFSRGLMDRCSNWLNSKFCPILIAIDEIHNLYTHRRVDVGSNPTLYPLLKSVMNELLKYPVVLISLSTVSHVSSPAPSKETAPSVRERSDERFLPAPFTELPFDVFLASEPLRPGQEMTSVGSLEFTSKFGRPLFYASYLSRKDKPSYIVDGIMRIVREKLSGRPWPPMAPADLDATSIAVLSARLLLELSPATANAKKYEEELVRNHLRLLYSVNDQRRTIVTGSSPEPLIAEASAQIMHYFIQENQPYFNYWFLLEKYVDHGLANQGAIGELIGRALSISAMDCAIENLHGHSELKYQTPITVADYYQAFLTNDAWEVLRKSTPANRSRLSSDSANTKFEDAFKNAYFHYSHYGKANDSSPMSDKYAWALWLRGTAVVCKNCQELTDRMAPIYFSDEGGVSPKTISVSLDQDKTGQDANPANIGIQSAEHLSIFSHGKKLPYITAVHCYALTKRQGITVSTESSHDLRKQGEDQEAPRYQIDFRGLSEYNISDSVKSTIRRMIDKSNDAVFYNHTRDYGVPLLRQMLPVLTKDADSTKWFCGLNSGAA